MPASRKRKAKKNTRRRVRRNQEAGGAEVPFETLIDVEQVRFHKDGTVDLLFKDSELPESGLQESAAVQNRRRAKNRKRRR